MEWQGEKEKQINFIFFLHMRVFLCSFCSVSVYGCGYTDSPGKSSHSCKLQGRGVFSIWGPRLSAVFVDASRNIDAVDLRTIT